MDTQNLFSLMGKRVSFRLVVDGHILRRTGKVTNVKRNKENGRYHISINGEIHLYELDKLLYFKILVY